MRLRAQHDAVGNPGCQCALDAGEDGVGCREALASPWRSLYQHQGRVAVLPDVGRLARLEAVGDARPVHRLQAGHKARLRLRRCGGPMHGCLGPRLHPAEEFVLPAGEQPLHHLGLPEPVDVIRVAIKGVELAVNQRLPEAREQVAGRVVAVHREADILGA